MSPTNEKHVLMLVQNLPVPFDRRVWLEANTLRDEGCLVSIICPATSTYSKSREKINGIDIIRFPLPWEGQSKIGIILEYIWSILWIFSLTTMISIRKRVHVVHFCNPPDLLFICALPAKFIWRSRMLYDQHDLCPEVWQTKNNNSGILILKLLRFFERATYKIADIVIATNDSYKNIAITRGRKSESSVFVVRSAPSLSFMNADPSQARDCLRDVRLVYLGTMGSQEGIDLLLSATQILKDRNTQLQIRLDLIGDGPERRNLEQQAIRLGLDDITFFHGRVSDSALRDLIMSADIAINPDRPSLFNSLSSMNKIVEYLALGVPIVQFHSIEGEVTAGAASVYVMDPNPMALANAINDLWQSPIQRQKMKNFSLSRFKEISWEKQAQELTAAYRNLLKGRS